MRRTLLLAFLVLLPLAAGAYILYSQQQAIDRAERRLDALPKPAPASEVESLAMRLGSLASKVRALEDEVERPQFGAKPDPAPAGDADVDELEQRVARLEREGEVDLAPLEERVAKLERKFQCLEARPELKMLYC